METLNVTGLSRERVRFLRELVSLWQSRNPVPAEPGFKKLRKEDLPPLPKWWQDALREAKDSPLARMSEKEIGQWTEDLAERGKQDRRARQASSS